MVNILLKVKEIVEARLEHLFGLLIKVEKCVRNPIVPDSLSKVVDEIIKNDTLSLSKFGNEFLRDFLSKMKEKYKKIFQKHK